MRQATPLPFGEARRPPPLKVLPSEICRGAVTRILFEGTAPSESRVEALLDFLGRGER